jgi:hypothetical protein
MGGMIGLSAGASGAEILDCRLRRGQGQEGLIAPQYLFESASDSVVAQVYDGLIAERLRRPALAAIRTEETRLVYGWQVMLRDGYGNPLAAEFRAEVARAGGQIRVEALIEGEVVADGIGRCGVAE